MKKYHHMGSRRASSHISIWTSALHKTRKQYCCSREHTVKKEDNARCVTCVHKLSLGHMSINKKFSEQISTQTCGPCDACRLPNSHSSVQWRGPREYHEAVIFECGQAFPEHTATRGRKHRGKATRPQTTCVIVAAHHKRSPPSNKFHQRDKKRKTLKNRPVHVRKQTN